MISRALVFLFFILMSFGTANATDAPEIKLRGDNDLGEYVSAGLTIEHLGVSVDIRAGLAQISLTATLRNETDDDTEARFSYPLPAGSVINDYALDLDGELVDGVLMPKERAETLYTDRVTASVDPGIAARTSDNRYQTRIYPIAANGGRRKIRLGFAVPVPTSGLNLPLAQSQSVEHVIIDITGDGADAAKTPLPSYQARNVTLSGDIFIPAVAAKPTLSRASDRKFLTLPLASKSNATKQDVKSITVIWDTSLSRDSKDLARERHLVSQVLTRLMPEKQSLIYGADRIDFAAPYQTATQLSAAIDRLSYDGATNLSSILNYETLARPDIRPDICLVITDGQSNLGPRKIPNLPCRVFTYSANTKANTDWLALLATQNAGTDLSGLGAEEAARLMGQSGGYLLANDQAGEIFSFGSRHWFLLDVTNVPNRLNIGFKHETKSLELRTLENVQHAAASSIWGQRQIAKLRTQGPQGFDAIVESSRHWNVQSEETAFLVLENIQDYIEGKIDPPENFPAELMQNYKEELAYALAEEAEELEFHLEDLRDEWENQIKWWETDWSKPVKVEQDQPSLVIPQAEPPTPVADTSCWDGSQVFDSGQCPAQPAAIMEAYGGEEECEDCDMIVVTGSRLKNPAGELPSDIIIETRPWSPNRPYLTALAETSPASFEKEYITQRKTYGDRPSFYLEVADQLYRNGRTVRAMRMAATALELESASAVTRTNVADRLLMYGQTQEAIALYRDVLPLAQDRPQPYYNLALALIQAGDDAEGLSRDAFYKEAFEHLAHIILAPWEDDYEGIHLIALQDLNRTLARLPKSMRNKMQRKIGLDTVFYRNLPVDIRVLIDWTANDADLDIHVIERVDAEDEETAYYRNRATKRGGRVSNDMTEGYGPEEYMIRRAPNGLYRVESDYYAQDDYSEDGALKLRARLWQNFGRENERFETVIIEMLEEKEEAYILGNIQIGPATEPVAVGRETE